MSAQRSTNLLIDNWTLQSVGQLLSGGLSGEVTNELEVASDFSGFSYKCVSLDASNVQCLFQLIGHLVFTDSLFVEEAHTNTWRRFDELGRLNVDGFVISKPFQEIREEWLPARERFIEELCVCPQMQRQHEKNVRSFKASGKSEDPYFGQLIWGGAGMLGRAHVLGIPYCGHPIREAWFSQVDSLFGQRSAEKRFQEFISEERVKVLNRVDSGGYLARLKLPPVAALAISEAKDPKDLINVALQLRGEYEALRNWLREFQTALDSCDAVDVLAYEKVLQSVSRNLEAQCTPFPVGDTTLQIGLSWLKGTFKAGDPVNSAKNLIGARAQMNRLVLAPAGSGVTRRLIKLFGEEKGLLGRELEVELGKLHGP